MKEVDYTIPVLVSGIFTLLLLAFYLYKSENRRIMDFLSVWFMKIRHKPSEIHKDTRKQDAIHLFVLIIFIAAFGLKLISFAVIISDSMRPEFQRGDLVLTQTIFKEPKTGDIVTFNARGVLNPVTHRVVNIREDKVTTKGDNNLLVDDYGVTKNDIIAKVMAINGHPVVIKGVGSYFILDFSKEGKLYKYGDQFTFLQQVFLTIRTWGYVITLVSFFALVMSMIGGKR